MEKIYRCYTDGYGDGSEDFDTLKEALQAKREWEDEYGEGEARVAIIDGDDPLGAILEMIR